MQPDTDDHLRRHTVLPLTPLVLLTVGALVLSWLLVPTEQQMADRVLKDRHFQQVISCLTAQGHVDAAKAAELRGMSGRRLAALARLFQLTSREQIQAIFDKNRIEDYDLLSHGLLLRAIQFVDVIAPREAFDIMRPNLDRVPGAWRVDLLELIGRNAHAVGDPGLAVECCRLACQVPEAGWPTLQRMAQTFRWESRSLEASEILRRWLREHEKALDAATRTEAHALQLVLSLEAGQPSIAFDLCLADLRALPADASPSRELLERSLQTAIFAGRGGEMLPWVEKFVLTLPDHDTPWNRLPKLAAAQPDRFVELKKWWGQIARLADWSGQPDRAFPAHLRAAALGDVDSLDRCLALHNWLGRTEECAELLQALGPVPGREDLAATLPRLLGNLGREREAIALFEHWLARHPEDNDTRHALTALLEDLGEDGKAIAQLEELLRRRPDDAVALAKLSSKRMQQKFFQKALLLLEAAPERAHTLETLEGYASLAGSLDRHESRLRALQLALKRKESPEPRDYQQLAEAASYTAKPQQALEILHDAIQRFPLDVPLRLALAGLHAQRQEFAEALAVVMHPPLSRRFEIVAFVLSLAPHVPDAGGALAFLGKDIESAFSLAPEDRLQLAVLHHKAGHTEDTARLFAMVPETPDMRRVIAEARFHSEGFDIAGRLMREQVREIQASASDWVFLGDIYERQGRADEAQQAYDHSLAILSADLPGTAAR